MRHVEGASVFLLVFEIIECREIESEGLEWSTLRAAAAAARSATAALLGTPSGGELQSRVQGVCATTRRRRPRPPPSSSAHAVFKGQGCSFSTLLRMPSTLPPYLEHRRHLLAPIGSVTPVTFHFLFSVCVTFIEPGLTLQRRRRRRRASACLLLLVRCCLGNKLYNAKQRERRQENLPRRENYKKLYHNCSSNIKSLRLSSELKIFTHISKIPKVYSRLSRKS